MPYGGIERPSIGLGLIQEILARDGVRAEVVYANIQFAERVGVVHYSLPDRWTLVEHFAGEWSFAEAAFGPREDPEDYLARLEQALTGIVPGGMNHASVRRHIVAGVRDLRRHAGPFINELAESILKRGPRIIGCTSTFQQHCASLALLRRIRELDPSVVTVLGGANCEVSMGKATHRNCPWVDFVVSGESDAIVGPLFRSLLENGPELPIESLPTSVLAPAHRRAALPLDDLTVATPASTPFAAIDTLPTPDYRDYFATLGESSLAQVVHPVLLIETSRGCWWGEKKHCTFCGLNANGMTFRVKSPDRVLEELDLLTERHAVNRIEAVDNILSMKFFDTLLPRLEARDRDWRFFFETKANLKRGHVEALKRAGVTMIQPGIESLHTEVLRLMKKGVHAWENVRLLKWARQAGVRVLWNILTCFPGERDEWYESVAELIPKIEHLDPPSGVSAVRFDRFSPYHTDSQAYGLRLEPAPLIRFVYPFTDADLQDQTYYFVDTARERDLPRRPGLAAAQQRIDSWRESFGGPVTPVFWYELTDNQLVFRDSRTCATRAMTTIEGLKRSVYLCCEDGISESRLHEELALRGEHCTVADAADAVESLVANHQLLRVDGRLLGLAVAGTPLRPRALEESPLGYVEPAYYMQELNRLVSGAAVAAR